MTLDLTTEQQSLRREPKETLHGLSFSEYVLMQMFLAFANAQLQGCETIVWMAGLVDRGTGYVFQTALPKLSNASSFCAETDHSWLLKWIATTRQRYPFVNLIVQAHIHPLGSVLSSVDERALLNLSDWHDEVYFASLVFDFDMGCYCVNDERITKLTWGIEGGWSEDSLSEVEECFTTSRPSLARRIFGRLSRRQ